MSAKNYTLYFNPSFDMTAFELASILLTVPWGDSKEPVAMTGITATEKEWKRMPPPLRKYFIKDNPLAKPELPPAPWDANEVGQGPPEELLPPNGPSFVPVPPPEVATRELPKGPSKQPDRPIPSFYHSEGVESLYPDGQEIS